MRNALTLITAFVVALASSAYCQTVTQGPYGTGTKGFLGSLCNNIQWDSYATGSSPDFAAAGCDANLNLNLYPKGTGSVIANGGFTVTGFANLKGSGYLGGGSNNAFQYNGNSAGNPPILQVIGDTNLSLELLAAGTGTVYSASPLQLKSTTVAGLPTCTAAIVGSKMYVTDATAPLYNTALTGGSNVGTQAICRGTGAGPTYAWVSD